MCHSDAVSHKKIVPSIAHLSHLISFTASRPCASLNSSTVALVRRAGMGMYLSGTPRGIAIIRGYNVGLITITRNGHPKGYYDTSCTLQPSCIDISCWNLMPAMMLVSHELLIVILLGLW